MKFLPALLVLWLPFAAFASEQESVRRAVESGRLKPLSEIIAQVQARYPGRILEVELDYGRDRRRVYEIELLSPQGNKLEVQIDAATGQFLEPESPSAQTAHIALGELLRHALRQWPGRLVEVKLEQGHYAADILREDGSQVRVLLNPDSGEVTLDNERGAALAGLLTLPELVERVQRDHPGQILEVELDRDAQGHWIFEVEIRTARGRTVELTLDAATGVVIDEDHD